MFLTSIFTCWRISILVVTSNSRSDDLLNLTECLDQKRCSCLSQNFEGTFDQSYCHQIAKLDARALREMARTTEVSSAPFACWCRCRKQYLLTCWSPTSDLLGGVMDMDKLNRNNRTFLPQYSHSNPMWVEVRLHFFLSSTLVLPWKVQFHEFHFGLFRFFIAINWFLYHGIISVPSQSTWKMAISMFFILSSRGDTIISKDYRGDMTPGCAEFFFRKVRRDINPWYLHTWACACAKNIMKNN